MESLQGTVPIITGHAFEHLRLLLRALQLLTGSLSMAVIPADKSGLNVSTYTALPLIQGTCSHLMNMLGTGCEDILWAASAGCARRGSSLVDTFARSLAAPLQLEYL